MDGRKYGTIVIGSQTWTNENISRAQYNNGDNIVEAKSIKEWITLCENKTGAWCYYSFNRGNNLCGRLYNWYAVKDPRGISPKGWHVPSANEWKGLIIYLGGGESASKKLKANYGWQFEGNGNNESGFSALPCGALIVGSFLNMGLGSYWLSTDGESFYNESCTVTYNKNIEIGTNFNKCGFSIRYIKD